MRKLVFALIAAASFASGAAKAGEWVVASVVGQGAITYVQGNRFRECIYQVPSTTVSFSITTTDYNCPVKIEYNMLTKQWRGI